METWRLQYVVSEGMRSGDGCEDVKGAWPRERMWWGLDLTISLLVLTGLRHGPGATCHITANNMRDDACQPGPGTARAGVAECRPADGRVPGSFSCPGRGLSPQLGNVQEAADSRFSLITAVSIYPLSSSLKPITNGFFLKYTLLQTQLTHW